MIQRFHVENYKALRAVNVDLSPITVLIGPNDSGKSSLLEAIGALCRSVDQDLSQAFAGRWQNADLVWQCDAGLDVTLEATLASEVDLTNYSLTCRFSPTADRNVRLVDEWTQVGGGERRSFGNRNHPLTTIAQLRRNPGLADPVAGHSAVIHDALSGVEQYRWVPDHLGLPAVLGGGEAFRMEPTGFGLVRCLDDILGSDRDRFTELEGRFRAYFPEIDRIQLVREPAYMPTGGPEHPVLLRLEGTGKGIHFVLAANGATIPASQASDGTLLVLAYLTVLYLPQPPRMLLIEEPENGIHPQRLKEVLSIVRELVASQQHTQVVMTTHSPYVLDLFDPSEVILCRKHPDGAIATTRLSDSDVVKAQRDVFTLGEIWTAEGDESLATSNAGMVAGA